MFHRLYSAKFKAMVMLIYVQIALLIFGAKSSKTSQLETEAEKAKIKKVSDFVSVTPQQCLPSDSCSERCVRDSATVKANSTLGQFNCFCDSMCNRFGDCCWDYESECDPTREPQLKHLQHFKNETFSGTSDNTVFECVVVDQFSKGSFWMVTDCTEDWKEDEIKRKCRATEGMEFDSHIPVQGETGLTYRNAFCAQCNHVNNYIYWSLQARCVRSAPEEGNQVQRHVSNMSRDFILTILESFYHINQVQRHVKDMPIGLIAIIQCRSSAIYALDNAFQLGVRESIKDAKVLNGNPEIFSYYLEHFCTVKLHHDEFLSDASEISSHWKKTLRPCVQGMVDECPNFYNNKVVIKACLSYQSIVIGKNHEGIQAFKNPYCALCHGVSSTVEIRGESFATTEAANAAATTGLSCPLWVLTSYYDNPFWKLDTNLKSKRVLPMFNKNYKSSSWIPPSFSVLINFNDDVEMKYQEDSSGSVVIPVQENCQTNQIYDPFAGLCRTVHCAEGLLYLNGQCVSKNNETEDIVTQPPSFPSSQVTTVTITITLSQTNSSFPPSFNLVNEKLVPAFEKEFNVTVKTNFTVKKIEPLATNSSGTNESETKNGSIEITVSLFLLEVGVYSEEEVVKIVENIVETVNFQKLMVEMDSYKILVVEHNRQTSNLVCNNEQIKVEYSSSEYRLDEFDGKKMIFVQKTNSYYSEEEFQLLDWMISIDENGVESKHLEESRAVVCFQTATSFTESSNSCSMYAPLNASEYVVMENNSLYLTDRDLVLSSDQYITYREGYAVCLDGLTQDPGGQSDIVKHSLNTTDVIMSWVIFGLTILSLVSLCFTFITYCLFSVLRTRSGCCIMNLTASLFAALLVFLFGATLTDPPALCTAIAIVLHYLYLASFFWNNVMAFDVWQTFGKGIKETFRMRMISQSTLGKSKILRRSIIRYMCYGWGAPLIVVGICSAIEFGLANVDFGYSHDAEDLFCWISNPLANIFSFGLPLALILLTNTFFFVFSIKAIQRVTARMRRHSSSSSDVKKKPTRSTSTQKNRKSNNSTYPKFANDENFSSKSTISCHRRASKSRFSSTSARVNVFVYIKMSTVMGFTWSVGFVSAIMPQVAALRYIFELLVPMQGIFIFFAFICKRRVWNLYKEFKNPHKNKGKKNCKLSTAVKTPNDEVKWEREVNEKTSSCSSSVTVLKSRSCSESTQDDML